MKISFSTGLLVILVAYLILGLALSEPSRAQAAAQDLTEQIKAANDRADRLEIQAKYKDYLLAQKDFDNLYQQFQLNDAVKAVNAKLDALRKELKGMEEKALAARGLKSDEWFLDFITGEVKQIEKPAASAAPPANP